MKKLWGIFTLCFVCVFCALCFTACNEKPNYSVSFISGNDIQPQIVLENTYVVKPDNPVKDGYNFAGWFKDADFTTEWNFETDAVTENVTLYAKWNKQISFTVSFISGNDIKPQAVLENTYVVKPDNPVKYGYNFAGWYKDADFTAEWNFGTDAVAENVTLYAKWEEIINEYTVQVTGDLLQGVTLSGGETTQIISKEKPFTPITVTGKYGYNYLYYVVDGKQYSDNVINFDEVSKNTTVNIVCDYATDELPIVNINTDGAAINSKTEYTDMTFSIENCDGELTDISGGIRIRGNSTSGYDKKPYRIKFDKKQSLFGLEKAKSWVLLADYLDPSCLHNYTALTLGNQLDGLSFTPTPHHVNVYINGEYNGLYVLCEQVQENQGRINIEKKITEDMTELKDFNFFICMDASVSGDTDAVLDETYFYLEDYDKYIELKYPEKSDFVNEEQFNCFFNQLEQYVKDLFDNFSNKNLDYINDNVNVESLIDYLIVDEIMMETDHAWKSFNMYYIGVEEQLTFGPIWDYDWSLFTPWTGKPNSYYTVSNDLIYSNIFFESVHGIPELYSQLKVRYNEVASKILDGFFDDIMIYEYSIEQSSELNAEKWYAEFDEEIRESNIIFLNKFLLNRKNVLDKEWAI